MSAAAVLLSWKKQISYIILPMIILSYIIYRTKPFLSNILVTIALEKKAYSADKRISGCRAFAQRRERLIFRRKGGGIVKFQVNRHVKKIAAGAYKEIVPYNM